MTTPVLIYDGTCRLCAASARMIERFSRGKPLWSLALQAFSAATVLGRYGAVPDDMRSVVFIDGERLFTKSTALLRLAAYLGGWWRLAEVFFIIPRPIRDFFYDIIADNRYHWFGTCKCEIDTASQMKQAVRKQGRE